MHCIKRGGSLSKEHLNSIEPSTQSAKKVHVYMLIMWVLIEEILEVLTELFLQAYFSIESYCIEIRDLNLYREQN